MSALGAEAVAPFVEPRERCGNSPKQVALQLRDRQIDVAMDMSVHIGIRIGCQRDGRPGRGPSARASRILPLTWLASSR